MAERLTVRLAENIPLPGLLHPLQRSEEVKAHLRTIDEMPLQGSGEEIRGGWFGRSYLVEAAARDEATVAEAMQANFGRTALIEEIIESEGEEING